MTKFLRTLNEGTPVNGRVIAENGDSVNLADTLQAFQFIDVGSKAITGRAFYVSHEREGVSSGDFFYTLQAGSNFAVAIVAAEFSANDGDLSVFGLPAANFNPAISTPTLNLRVGSPDAEANFFVNPPNVSGDEFLLNKIYDQTLRGNIVSSINAPIIINPTDNFTFKFSNENNNSKITFSLLFVESEFPS